MIYVELEVPSKLIASQVWSSILVFLHLLALERPLILLSIETFTKLQQYFVSQLEKQCSSSCIAIFCKRTEM